MKRQRFIAGLILLGIVLSVMSCGQSRAEQKTEVGSLKGEIEELVKRQEETEKKLADLKEYISQITGVYIGAKGREPFHLLFCEWAKRINPENRVFYRTRQEAIADGRRPCKVCNP